jgi:hypothetical protein
MSYSPENLGKMKRFESQFTWKGGYSYDGLQLVLLFGEFPVKSLSHCPVCQSQNIEVYPKNWAMEQDRNATANWERY